MGDDVLGSALLTAEVCMHGRECLDRCHDGAAGYHIGTNKGKEVDTRASGAQATIPGAWSLRLFSPQLLTHCAWEIQNGPGEPLACLHGGSGWEEQGGPALGVTDRPGDRMQDVSSPSQWGPH